MINEHIKCVKLKQKNVLLKIDIYDGSGGGGKSC